jgi:hypothetical protein
VVEITDSMKKEIAFPMYMPCYPHAYCVWNIRNNQTMKVLNNDDDYNESLMSIIIYLFHSNTLISVVISNPLIHSEGPRFNSQPGH